ncbi:MAG: hypothetical protein AAFX93_10640 [Verrucomicrobiota bacterium]
MESEPGSTELWLVLAGMLTLLAIAAAAALRYNLGQHGKLVEQFRILADKFDLELTIPEATMYGLYRRNPTLYGRFKGHEISIFPKGYGLDNTRQTDIAIRVSTKAKPDFQFTLAQRNLTGRLGQLGRLKEAQTGDQRFEAKYSLRSNSPDEAVALINDQWRSRVEGEWIGIEGFLSLHDGVITFLQVGLPYQSQAREQVERMVEFCVALSDEL